MDVRKDSFQVQRKKKTGGRKKRYEEIKGSTVWGKRRQEGGGEGKTLNRVIRKTKEPETFKKKKGKELGPRERKDRKDLVSSANLGRGTESAKRKVGIPSSKPPGKKKRIPATRSLTPKSSPELPGEWGLKACGTIARKNSLS